MKTYTSILVLCIGLLIGVLVTHYYDIYSFGALRFPISRQTPEFNDLNYGSLNLWWDEKSCTVPKASSLINLAHIKRLDGKYEISCEYGPLYKELDYSNFNGTSVFYGLIMNCDEEAAREIDTAVRTVRSCIFPMANPIPDALTDYYVFYAVCTKVDPKNYTMCTSDLLNQNKDWYSGAVGVIDPSMKYVYY